MSMIIDQALTLALSVIIFTHITYVVSSAYSHYGQDTGVAYPLEMEDDSSLNVTGYSSSNYDNFLNTYGISSSPGQSSMAYNLMEAANTIGPLSFVSDYLFSNTVGFGFVIKSHYLHDMSDELVAMIGALTIMVYMIALIAFVWRMYL